MHAKSGQRSIASSTLNREVKGVHTEKFEVDPPFYKDTPTMTVAIAGIEMFTTREGGDSHRHSLGVQLEKPVFDISANTVTIKIHKKQGLVIPNLTVTWMAVGE